MHKHEDNLLSKLKKSILASRFLPGKLDNIDARISEQIEKMSEQTEEIRAFRTDMRDFVNALDRPSKMDEDDRGRIVHLSEISDVASWHFDNPYVFTSSACRSDHFSLPLYAHWAARIKDSPPRYHRKQWEFVYIAHALWERGYLKQGNRGIGFGVGTEPLLDLFVSFGCSVLGTDLPLDDAVGTGWIETNQHSNTVDALYKGISDRVSFDKLASFREVDMNHIPADLNNFDFCYSSCSIEHVGSLDLSKKFLRDSVNLLRPGGLSIHTTELNLSSNEDTLESGPTVIWRRKDFEEVADQLRKEGHEVAALDFNSGDGPVDRSIDVPLHLPEPHLKLKIAQYDSTSFGFIVKKAN